MNPGDYQTAAVDAAAFILKGRQVTGTEAEEVNNYFKEIKIRKELKKETIDSYKEKAADLLQPLIQPSAKIDPQKWLNLFLIAVTLQYLWLIILDVKYSIRTIGLAMNNRISFDLTTFFLNLISLIYIPIIFFLLYKKRRWGWILLFADNAFGLFAQIGNVYTAIKFRDLFHPNFQSFIFPIFIKSLFIFFLWKVEISDHFSVTEPVKKKTALSVTAILLGLAVIMILL